MDKADPEVFNVLLQVLDDGRITDGQLPVPVGPGGPEDLERRVREAVVAR